MARIVITGGAGFLGRRLMSAIVAAGQVVLPAGKVLQQPELLCLDVGPTRPETLEASIQYRQVQIEDTAALRAVFAEGVDAVFHLAAVVSSAAEADFDLGMRVNLAGSLSLFEGLRQVGGFVPLVTTSSIATAGLNGAPPVSSYGVQKSIAELLGYDFRRRGLVDVRTLRLPTIVVRPGKPNAAASSFASGIIREPLNGLPSVCPVAPELPMWVASPDAAVRGMLHAMNLGQDDWPQLPAVNLPGLTVTVGDMVKALEEIAGPSAAMLVSWERNSGIDRIVASWPASLDVGAAKAIGFGSDASYAAIVQGFAGEIGALARAS